MGRILLINAGIVSVSKSLIGRKYGDTVQLIQQPANVKFASLIRLIFQCVFGVNPGEQMPQRKFSAHRYSGILVLCVRDGELWKKLQDRRPYFAFSIAMEKNIGEDDAIGCINKFRSRVSHEIRNRLNAAPPNPFKLPEMNFNPGSLNFASISSSPSRELDSIWKIAADELHRKIARAQKHGKFVDSRGLVFTEMEGNRATTLIANASIDARYLSLMLCYYFRFGVRLPYIRSEWSTVYWHVDCPKRAVPATYLFHCARTGMEKSVAYPRQKAVVHWSDVVEID